MLKKIRNVIILIACLFMGGSIMIFIGFSKGHDIANLLSRPRNAFFWTTTEEMLMACTYTPVIIGISLIVLAIIFSTVLFIKWLNNTTLSNE